MEIERYIRKIVDDGDRQEMEELSDILVEVVDIIKRYDEKHHFKTKVHEEDWHIRFVGDKSTAREIERSKLCLEEYVELLQKQEL